MIIVVGKIRGIAGAEPVLEAAARKAIEGTNGEAGVIEYSFFQDPVDPRSFTILEVWQDEESFAHHVASDHLREFRSAVYPVLEYRDVKVFDGGLRQQ